MFVKDLSPPQFPHGGGGKSVSGFAERVFQLVFGDEDVGEVETVLREFGAEEDETEVSIAGDGRMFRTLRAETY